jgi:5-methylcytosine-specific restriction endonuclease McrA
MINRFVRYQKGLSLHSVFPVIIGKCACGCRRKLQKSRQKWFSDECRDNAYIKFAIIKGDISVIRHQLFLRDAGACMNCGVITNNWDAHHTKPVHQGGGACGLYNFQTLCRDCHKDTTYKVLHADAISKQAASTSFILRVYDEGALTLDFVKTSKERQSFKCTGLTFVGRTAPR